MAVCEHCGKKSMVGNRVSHSQRKTKHRFEANIQPIHVIEGDKSVRKHLCTKCIKALNKV